MTLRTSSSLRRVALVAWGVLISIGATGCAEESADEARTGLIVSVLTRADEATILSRPELVAGKYSRMANYLYDFYRGTFALFARDIDDPSSPLAEGLSRRRGPLILGQGDVHPENMGALLARDGTLALEPNDFDGADYYPWLWEVRRMCLGLALAARLSNPDDLEARALTREAEPAIVEAFLRAYVSRLIGVSRGEHLGRITSAPGSPVLQDLFRRSARDLASRDELSQLTVMREGKRTLRRGILDPAEPTQQLLDVLASGHRALDETMLAYQRTLIAPPEASYFEVLDVAREVGSGVASWPRVRVLLLVRGPSDAPEDDVILEMKEIGDSGLPPIVPPYAYFDDVGARVLFASRAIWAVPDAEPLWGVSAWLGFPVQIRRRSEAQKTVRVDRMEGDLGTPASLSALGEGYASLLARVHAREGGAEAVLAAVGDLEGFVAEQTRIASAYADQLERDHVLFKRALEDRGVTLGRTGDENDVPSAELRSLFTAGEPL